MSEKQSANGSEVVVEVRSDKQTIEAKRTELASASEQSKVKLRVSTECSGMAIPNPIGSPSPEVSISNEDNTINRRNSLNRSVFSRPISGEESVPINSSKPVPVGFPSQDISIASHNPGVRAISIYSARDAPGGVKANEYEKIYRKVLFRRNKHRKVKKKMLSECILFLCILGCLVASVTVQKLKNLQFWAIEAWKWCLLVLEIFHGMFVANLFMHFIAFVIGTNILLRKKVLYYVHKMKKSVEVFMWLGMVLFTWLLLFNCGIERSKTSTKILDYVMWTPVSGLIGAFLWSLKTLLFEIFAIKHQVDTFYLRIKETIFHQYVLQTLSGAPLMEEADGRSSNTRKLYLRRTKKTEAGKEKEVIDIGKLQKLKQDVSAWTMNVLVDAIISSSGLPIISHTSDDMEIEKEITSEMGATAAADDIFRNVAQLDAKYIEKQDLLRFMDQEVVDHVWPLIDVADTGQVDRKTVTEWVVKVYNGRKASVHTLTDTNKCVNQFNKLVISIVIVITIVVWLLLVGIATIKVLLLLSSQLVLAAFMFGNTCKNIFEAIVFVFVTHPFDTGDRCVVDGVPLLVKEMSLLTTVFLKLNDEMVYYPNSVLSTKTISNYNRSPHMGDTVEFTIDMISVDKICQLKIKIKEYFEGARQYWHEKHSVAVTEMENASKLKMELHFKHTMNFQEFREKNVRRAELIMALMKILEELKIIYYLLPQEVHLAQTKSDASVATSDASVVI